MLKEACRCSKSIRNSYFYISRHFLKEKCKIMNLFKGGSNMYYPEGKQLHLGEQQLLADCQVIDEQLV